MLKSANYFESISLVIFIETTEGVSVFAATIQILVLRDIQKQKSIDAFVLGQN